LTYFDEVVRFIEKNTAGISLGVGGAEGYSDPFTGKEDTFPDCTP
jgi:phospholipase A-2-activating protein